MIFPEVERLLEGGSGGGGGRVSLVWEAVPTCGLPPPPWWKHNNNHTLATYHIKMVQEGKNGPEKDLRKYVGKEEKETENLRKFFVERSAHEKITLLRIQSAA